jgi:hypothetical protein
MLVVGEQRVDFELECRAALLQPSEVVEYLSQAVVGDTQRSVALVPAQGWSARAARRAGLEKVDKYVDPAFARAQRTMRKQVKADAKEVQRQLDDAAKQCV